MPLFSGLESLDDENQRRMLEQMRRFMPTIGWGGFGGFGGDFWDIGSQIGGSIISPQVPVVIGEIPQTWEELEQLDPELFEPILETRPGRTPDPYPQGEGGILGDPQAGDTAAQVEDEPMAHDWGHLIRTGIGDVLGWGDATETAPAGGWSQTPGAGPVMTGPLPNGHAPAAGCDGMAWSGGTPPKGYKVVNYCGRGVLRKIRRRRRRRILSASDAADIATIVGLVGKGQMASALINRRG